MTAQQSQQPAPQRRIRVGLIGLGNNMLGHVRRLLEIPEVEIVAGVDPVGAMQARFKERYPQLAGVPLFASHEEMLRTAQPEAVEISTPHNLHFRQIVDSLESGAHVLVEKPMVNSVREAEAVLRARDAAGKIVLVSYQRHTQPMFTKIKQLIDEGVLGEIEFIQALQNQQWYANKFRTPEAAAWQRGEASRPPDLPWRVSKDVAGGGQLNDSGSHLVDILLYVTGLEPESVYAAQQRFMLEVDVNSAIAVTFTNGAIGNVSIVGQAPGIGGAVWEDITIYGSKGALCYRMLGQPEHKPTLELRLINRDEPLDLGELPAGSTPDRNFVDAILGRDTVKSPAECGLRVMQLSEAAWKSAETGQPVQVRSLSAGPK
ncbi:MAG TPA: Gfo/Idh/MocA family oxidoreductase [Chloroflexota bacterium]|jgi:predicted dehydrogenase|nr:Gfo/Idh/MocA family oxidoreductase [Chloroflexota bacterium]